MKSRSHLLAGIFLAGCCGTFLPGASGQQAIESEVQQLAFKNTVVPGELPSIGVTADSVDVPVGADGVRISGETKRIIFKIGNPDDGIIDPNAKRVQYKLDGVDTQWNERRGDMCITAAFYGKDGRVVGKRFFQVFGNSVGWKGSFAKSTFTQSHETFIVPANAVRLGITISSAGPPDALGVLIVKNLQVFRDHGHGQMTTIVDSNLHQEFGATPQWIRDGTNPEMATLFYGGKPGLENIFAVFDNDPLGHAEWHILQNFQPAVTANEQLTIRWDSMYSIGLGYMFYTTYGTLPSGHYRFRIKELDLMGHPLAGERNVDIEIPRPYWSNPWLWLAAAVLLAALIAGLFRLIIRAKMRRMHQENAVERERLRIAQDIHDDLGARLTHVSLLSGFGKNHAVASTDQDRFEKIATMTQDMVSSLYQTIWTVSPENDSLDSLVNFLCQLIHNLCEPAGISCRIQSDKSFENRLVTSETRHNISMAVRESVNNALKHSGATEIRFTIVHKNARLTIRIEDNGCGFDPNAIDGGSGLINIRNRVERIGGTVAIETKKNGGTTISMDVAI